MLAPDERSILRDLLRPPVDHTLDIAVATSFTLDLSSALIAPLAFAAYEIDGPGDPVALLEAVRSAADRVTIFSQVGYLRIPRKASDVMAFLEPMIYEVSPPNAGYLFHPKVWVLRYLDPDGTASYRLVCGTRNLTPDTSWDAVVALDGVVESRKQQARNSPVVDFVRALPGLSIRPLPGDRAQAIEDLADELAAVTWQPPAGVDNLDFHALGLGRRGASTRLWDRMIGTRNIVVSPFVDDETIKWYRELSTELTVVSRPHSLEQLAHETVDELQCRILDPMAAIADTDEDQDDGADNGTGDGVGDEARTGAGVLGGLHAKVYVAETRARARLLIGSSNATSAGLDEGNVEFMVDFEGHRKQLGVDQFLGDDGFGPLLNEYSPTGGEPSDPIEDAGRELEKLLRTLAARRFTATISQHPDSQQPGSQHSGHWFEHVATAAAAETPDEVRLTVGLLTLAGTVVDHGGGAVDARFTLTTIADITPFVCLRLEQQVSGQRLERSTVVRAELIGDPEGRLDEVLARQVDTPEKFLHFLMLLLALGDGQPPPSTSGAGAGDPWVFGTMGERGVLESLMRALSEQPMVIDDLDRLVTRLRSTESGAQVLPVGFDTVWSVIVEAKKRLGASVGALT